VMQNEGVEKSQSRTWMILAVGWGAVTATSMSATQGR
jgi:hypothetical protein